MFFSKYKERNSLIVALFSRRSESPRQTARDAGSENAFKPVEGRPLTRGMAGPSFSALGVVVNWIFIAIGQ